MSYAIILSKQYNIVIIINKVLYFSIIILYATQQLTSVPI